MTLKERIFAAETTFGKLLIKLSLIIAVTVATIGEGAKYMEWIPQDLIPMWFKTTIGLILLAAGVYGKLTVKDEKVG